MQSQDSKLQNTFISKSKNLEVEVTPKFVEIVKKYFNLPSSDEVSNEHIKLYVMGALKTAVDRAEKGEYHVE
jgi:hypothetical protein